MIADILFRRGRKGNPGLAYHRGSGKKCIMREKWMELFVFAVASHKLITKIYSSDCSVKRRFKRKTQDVKASIF